MDYSCQDINKITNPGLKRLYTIRCNRYKASDSEPIINNSYYNGTDNLNINYLYLLLILFIICVIFFNSNNESGKRSKK